MLTKLTQKQEQLLIKIRDAAIQKAFSTKLNKRSCKAQVKKLYKETKLAEPIVIFLDSPMSVQVGVNYAKALLIALLKKPQNYDQVHSQVHSQVGSQVYGQVYGQVHSQVYGQVYGQVHSQVDRQVRSQVDSQVYGQVYGQVYSQVGSQVHSQVHSQVYGQVYSQVGSQVHSQVDRQVDRQVRSQVGSQVHSQVYGQVGSQVRSQKLEYHPTSTCDDLWDAGWVAYYDFFEKIGIVKYEGFTKYKKYLASGIYFPVYLEGLAIIGRCPSILTRDTQNRLHNTKAPAIEWADGYGQHYVSGVYFSPEDFKRFFIEKTFVPEDIFLLKNTEQKTALIQHYGYGYFVDSLKDKTILDTFDGAATTKALKHLGISAVTKKPVHYELIEFTIQDTTRARVLKVECHSVHKPTFLGVPIQDNTKTVFGALAWTVPPELNQGKDMTADQYINEMEYET